MKILREGDRGYALAPKRGRVEIVYEYRTVELETSKAKVQNVLVGVDAETGEVLTVPAQSTPKLKAAREAKKEEGGERPKAAGAWALAAGTRELISSACTRGSLNVPPAAPRPSSAPAYPQFRIPLRRLA